MIAAPNLVTESGREAWSVADRIGMLRADLMYAPFAGVDDRTRASADAIHDLKVTIGAIRGIFELYEAALARGTTEAQLAKGAHRMLSPHECWVLAWRRGGHLEWKRVVRLQRVPLDLSARP